MMFSGDNEGARRMNVAVTIEDWDAVFLEWTEDPVGPLDGHTEVFATFTEAKAFALADLMATQSTLQVAIRKVRAMRKGDVRLVDPPEPDK